jgi:hypothetical protein
MFEISADRLASIRAQIQKGAKEAAKHYPVSIHTQTDDDGAANAQMLERKVDILERVCDASDQFGPSNHIS